MYVCMFVCMYVCMYLIGMYVGAVVPGLFRCCSVVVVISVYNQKVRLITRNRANHTRNELFLVVRVCGAPGGDYR